LFRLLNWEAHHRMRMMDVSRLQWRISPGPTVVVVVEV
jgi:hypothetical protein